MMCAKPFLVMKTPAQLKRAKSAEEMLPTPVPCGQCLHCRINKHREIKHRILLEECAHDESCFLTLTYSDENLPKNNNLDPVALQKYWKRLRKKIWPKKLRYFAVGEYGLNGERGINPHYHAAVFGLGQQYDSILTDAWRLGHTFVGSLTKDSASYIAGYTLKKLTKRGDVRLAGRPPEFFRSSRAGGGIGFPGIQKINESLAAYPFHEQEQNIRELNYGGYAMPLGRYLTVKLAGLLNLSDKLKIDNQKYNEEIVLDALRKNNLIKEGIVETNKIKRLKQRKRHAINQSRKVRSL